MYSWVNEMQIQPVLSGIIIWPYAHMKIYIAVCIKYQNHLVQESKCPGLCDLLHQHKVTTEINCYISTLSKYLENVNKRKIKVVCLLKTEVESHDTSFVIFKVGIFIILKKGMLLYVKEGMRRSRRRGKREHKTTHKI